MGHPVEMHREAVNRKPRENESLVGGRGGTGKGKTRERADCWEDKIISGTSECKGFRWKRHSDQNPGRERTIIDAD